MLNQYAVGNPTSPVNQRFFPPFSKSWRNAAAKCLGHAWYIGKRFCKSNGVSNVSEHTSPHVMIESQTPAQDQRCQSGPSARNSLVREEFQRIMGQTMNDCRLKILILTNSPRQQRSLVGRYDSRLRYVFANNFLRKLCCGSMKWRWLSQFVFCKRNSNTRF